MDWERKRKMGDEASYTAEIQERKSGTQTERVQLTEFGK